MITFWATDIIELSSACKQYKTPKGHFHLPYFNYMKIIGKNAIFEGYWFVNNFAIIDLKL